MTRATPTPSSLAEAVRERLDQTVIDSGLRDVFVLIAEMLDNIGRGMMHKDILRAAIKAQLEQELGCEAQVTDALVDRTVVRVEHMIESTASLTKARARSERELRDRAANGNLKRFLELLPPELSMAEIGRRAMGFLVRAQYAGRTPPDCSSVRDLMAS